MSKRVFVSYSHRQGQWVWERLAPILRAAGCAEVLIDRERFRAGRGVKGQMDATQEQADVSLLVLTPDYLASDYCRHEMDRALVADPDYQRDKVLPVERADCDLSAFQRAHDPPLWVDLTNDTDPAPWALLLKSLDATHLNTAAPQRMNLREELVRRRVEETTVLNSRFPSASQSDMLRGDDNARSDQELQSMARHRSDAAQASHCAVRHQQQWQKQH
jgi:hypothetical protein